MPDRFRQARISDYYKASNDLQKEHDLQTKCRAYQLMHYEPLAFYNNQKKLVITGAFTVGNEWKDKAITKLAIANMDELTRICNTYNFFTSLSKGGKVVLMCGDCIKAFKESKKKTKTAVKIEEVKVKKEGDDNEPYSSPLSSLNEIVTPSPPSGLEDSGQEDETMSDDLPSVIGTGLEELDDVLMDKLPVDSPSLSPSSEQVGAELKELLADVPLEERYCICDSIFYGEMIACDDPEVR